MRTSLSPNRRTVVSPRRRALVVAFGVAILASSIPFSAPLEAEVVQHIGLFQFKEDAAKDAVREALLELDAVASRVPGIIGYQSGMNNSPENLDKGFTHAFITTFESVEARDAYFTNPARMDLAQKLAPLTSDRFVFNFLAPVKLEAAEPGRVHHLVFFKYKEGTAPEKIEEVEKGFAELPRLISGLLSLQSGTEHLGKDQAKGLTHGYLLTFVNGRARNDYLIHPAHVDFVKLLGPVLGDVLVVDFTAVPSSKSLFVVDGLEPYAVYQRDPDGTADLAFSGVSRDDGPIEARLRSGRRTVPGFDWRQVGKAEGGAFQAVLENVPTGGEYTVEVRRLDAVGYVADHTEVANILVGDIWILAGQSNMEGVGDLANVEEPSPLVHCYTMAHRWELAVEPLHWLIDSPDPVHSGGLKGLDEAGRREARAKARETRRKGAGLGLPFATFLVKETGVPVGLIASAHGGTSMAQWDPALRDTGAASLYGSMHKQVKNAGGKVRGVLWYQGESDANPDAAPLFAERFKGLVAAIRTDFGDPKLPFLYVQIGRFVLDGGSEHWDRIQELQRLAEAEIPSSGMISVIDLPLDDLIHVGTSGLKVAGARLGKLALREVFARTDLLRGPRPSGVEIADGGRTVRVRFSDVNGSLSPAEKVEGFSLRRADGAEVKLIYSAAVDPGAEDTVVLKLQNPAPEGAFLWYGAGLDPVCNLVDAEGLAAPVFGPMKVAP